LRSDGTAADKPLATAEFRIKYPYENIINMTTDAGCYIENFIEGVSNIGSSIAGRDARLRLGIFCSLDETITIPLFISAKCIKMINELNLSMDFTGYIGTNDPGPTFNRPMAEEDGA
jgi:hypothetical protein